MPAAASPRPARSGGSVLGRQQDRVVDDVEADFVERKVRGVELLREHHAVIAVTAPEGGGLVCLSARVIQTVGGSLGARRAAPAV